MESEGRALRNHLFSEAEQIAVLGDEERSEWMAKAARDELIGIEDRWKFWARPHQMAPEGKWRIWLMLAGRGFGKTRAGAEWVRGLANGAKAGRIALVGATMAEARRVMVEGESGLLAISPFRQRPWFEPSRGRLSWRSAARTWSRCAR